MAFSCSFLRVLIAVVVLVSAAAASRIDYEQQQQHGGFEPVTTVDTDALMRANDKEYLVKKTANLVDLFYETGYPKRIAKFVRMSGALLDANTSSDPMVNEIFGECRA